jgi:hypothetical protein
VAIRKDSGIENHLNNTENNSQSKQHKKNNNDSSRAFGTLAELKSDSESQEQTSKELTGDSNGRTAATSHAESASLFGDPPDSQPSPPPSRIISSTDIESMVSGFIESHETGELRAILSRYTDSVDLSWRGIKTRGGVRLHPALRDAVRWHLKELPQSEAQ